MPSNRYSVTGRCKENMRIESSTNETTFATTSKGSNRPRGAGGSPRNALAMPLCSATRARRASEGDRSVIVQLDRDPTWRTILAKHSTARLRSRRTARLQHACRPSCWSSASRCRPPAIAKPATISWQGAGFACTNTFALLESATRPFRSAARPSTLRRARDSNGGDQVSLREAWRAPTEVATK